MAYAVGMYQSRRPSVHEEQPARTYKSLDNRFLRLKEEIAQKSTGMTVVRL
jgi:hypothetical protein